MAKRTLPDQMIKLKLLVLLPIALAPILVMAQPQTAGSIVKMGYVDVQQIVQNLPDTKKVEDQMKEMETKLVEHVNAKTNDLKLKYDQFVKSEKTMPAAIRTSTINELQQLQANLEQLKQDAQQNLDKKHNELMQPVYDKIGRAIDAVAKREGYTFILNSGVRGEDIVIYADPAFEITDHVLKELGVTSEIKR